LEVAGKYMNEEMEDHQEVEWQFDALDVRPVSKWLQRDWQGRDPSVVSGETRELTDNYFDTEDWRIYRAGYALRIRRTRNENRAEATMKLLASMDGKAGFRNRREISEPLDSSDPEVLSDAPVLSETGCGPSSARKRCARSSK
jgi:triphosphatase